MKKKNKFQYKIKINISLILLNFFINFLTNESVLFPKVSVFLPIYNKDLYIERGVKSIQDQTLKDIEIIAVNDFSTDNSLKILKKLSKKDKRIKIVNNDRNHGLLYSRAMGILNSSGEYVMNLDPDDEFSNKNNLKILYDISKTHKLDIIIFLLHKIKGQNLTIFNKHIKDLSKNNYKSNNIKIKYEYPLITNKFIKNEIIIKCYDFYKKKIYGNKWNYHEDNIWDILIKKFSKTKLYLNRIIYLYLLNKESLMKNKRNSLEIKNYIYRFEMIEKIYRKKNFWILKNVNSLLHNANKFFKEIIKKDLEIKRKMIHLYIKYNNFF